MRSYIDDLEPSRPKLQQRENPFAFNLEQTIQIKTAH